MAYYQNYFFLKPSGTREALGTPARLSCGPCIVCWQEILSPSHYPLARAQRNWNRASGPGTASGLLFTRIRRLRYRCYRCCQSASRPKGSESRLPEQKPQRQRYWG